MYYQVEGKPEAWLYNLSMVIFKPRKSIFDTHSNKDKKYHAGKYQQSSMKGWRRTLCGSVVLQRAEQNQVPQGTGPPIVGGLTHNQGNIGVPLPRGLRCQGRACYGAAGAIVKCPRGGGISTEVEEKEAQEATWRERGGRCCGERRKGEWSQFVPRERVKAHQETGKYVVSANLCCLRLVLIVSTYSRSDQ